MYSNELVLLKYEAYNSALKFDKCDHFIIIPTALVYDTLVLKLITRLPEKIIKSETVMGN